MRGVAVTALNGAPTAMPTYTTPCAASRPYVLSPHVAPRNPSSAPGGREVQTRGWRRSIQCDGPSSHAHRLITLVMRNASGYDSVP